MQPYQPIQICSKKPAEPIYFRARFKCNGTGSMLLRPFERLIQLIDGVVTS